MTSVFSLLAGITALGSAPDDGRIVPNPLPRIVTSSSGEFAVSSAPLPVDSKRPGYRMTVRLVRVERDASIQRLWSTTLDYWPGKILVSDDGRIATVDEWVGFGQHAVTLFNDKGGVLANYKLEDFMTLKERNGLPMVINGPLQWLEEARFETANVSAKLRLATQLAKRPIKTGSSFPPNGQTTLAVRLYNGRTVWFDPVTGKPARFAK